MAYSYKRIDVDSHIQEKPGTWTSRLSRDRWGARIPHIESRNGKDQWIIDEKPTDFLCICPAVMPDRVTYPTRWEQIPIGVYEGKDRLPYMNRDGIDCMVMYAHVTGVSGERFLGMEPDFEEVCVRAYNDLQTEEWVAVNPYRFVALTVPPHSSMDRTIKEVTRTARLGHRGVILYGTPHLRGLPNYSDPYWEPLWKMCEESSMVINMHGSGSAPKTMRIEPPPGTEERRAAAAVAASGFSIQPQYFANFLFAGVLERHPKLKFVGAESGIGWLPWLLEASDHAWQFGRLWNHGMPNKPSDLFHRQCYVDFWYEVSALQEYRYIIGVDHIMWESDFPHPTALWPDTQKFLAKSLQGVPEAEQRQILVNNAVKVYRLDAM